MCSLASLSERAVSLPSPAQNGYSVVSRVMFHTVYFEVSGADRLAEG